MIEKKLQEKSSVELCGYSVPLCVTFFSITQRITEKSQKKRRENITTPAFLPVNHFNSNNRANKKNHHFRFSAVRLRT